MDTIVMNSENSKTSNNHRLILSLSDKIKLKRNDKYFVLSNFNIYYTCKSIKNPYKNNKFKLSALTWNEEYKLPHESNSVSDIQN